MGIPQQALFAAALDPRFKFLPFLQETEKEQLWHDLSTEILARTSTCPSATPSPLSTSPPRNEAMSDPIISAFLGDAQGCIDESPALDFSTVLQREIREFRGLRVLWANPLDFWKGQAHNFKNLAIMARQYLAIPATTASSERLFSIAGNVISDDRSRLHHERATALILLKANRDLFP
jgi:hypothetical protein